uniref:Saposin B-type domain-containing protein n=1 Tax=Ascaris lumbricoides TaxID=6252 RepID=A0A0M3IK50_ASCLU
MGLKGGKATTLLWLLTLPLIDRSSAKFVLPLLGRQGALEGIVCDFCIKTMQGIVYDIGVLRNKMLQEVEHECAAFFKEKSEKYEKCVRVLDEQVEKLTERLEEILNPNVICARLRLCAKINHKNRTRHSLNLLVHA